MTFDVIENPVTGERAVVRFAATNAPGGLVVGDLYARPGAAVVGEHIHPHSTETFTVVRGSIGVRLGGHEQLAGPGTRISVPPGTCHDWWNVGQETAWVIVEVAPGHRFETMIKNLFFLAADGRTDARGRPGLMQAALLAREFDDVIRFTSPPRVVQKVLFAAIAPLARRRGYLGSYPEYERRVTATVEELEPLPADIAALLPAGVPGAAPGGPPG